MLTISSLSTLSVRLLHSDLRTEGVSRWLSNAGWTGLRLIAGVVMIHNGLDKLADIEGFAAAYVEVIGLPFPILFAYLAAYTELIGAPLLALGLLTRPAAIGLFSTMVVAMYHHILVAGLSIPYLELSALYAATFLGFAINGSGIYGLDHVLAKTVYTRVASSRLQQLESLENSYQVSERIAQTAEEGSSIPDPLVK